MQNKKITPQNEGLQKNDEVDNSRLNKDNKFRGQLRLYFETLFNNAPMTNRMVHELTGIPIEAGTRYKRTLEKSLRLWVVKKGIDPKSKHEACFISTSPNYKPKNYQMNLFEQKENSAA